MKTGNKKKRFGFFKRLMLIINLLFVAALLIAYLGYYLSPEVSFMPAIFGLAYPVLLISNLLFVFFWIFKRKKYFLFSLLAILAGFNFIGDYFQLSGNNIHWLQQDDAFKVLSFNVHNLTENNYRQISDKQNKIFQYVLSESPDIVCMQEFHSMGDNYYYPLLNLKESLEAKNYYFESYYNPYKKKIVGMVIFSKFQRVGKGILSHDATRNFGIYNDFVKDTDTFRVYNIHLESVYLNRTDYDMITGKIERENLREKSFRVLGKLKTAFEHRALQVEMLEDELKECPYPVIICGDFNDTPTSYAFRKLSKNLHDAYRESGSGIGKTFSGKIPFLRIDYILYDPVFTASNYKTEVFELSDHYPISCYLSLQK